MTHISILSLISVYEWGRHLLHPCIAICPVKQLLHPCIRSWSVVTPVYQQ